MLHKSIECHNDEKEFKFTPENLAKVETIIAKYPPGCQQSAVMPLLDLAQRQNNNWLSKEAMDYVASMLGMQLIKVYEIASFYSMFNLKPVGKYLLQVCRTTPCWLKGAEDITVTCKKKLGIELGETTEDNNFTLIEVECLGACVNGPVIQVNDCYYENLTTKKIETLLDEFAQE
jgi:NADH-quinone oxidoreductase E subunit